MRILEATGLSPEAAVSSGPGTASGTVCVAVRTQQAGMTNNPQISLVENKGLFLAPAICPMGPAEAAFPCLPEEQVRNGAQQ